ncbi:hypothetical protein SLS62_005626 [Diatrype stigma]|uniref:Uncharacterized protein n=1 Tax=Diatrype stigma TaxID=117547 RepID=A0AAN9URD0_9PEZI
MTAKIQLLILWLLLALQVYAQRYDGQYWPCNPMKNNFTNPPKTLDDEWSTSNFATVTYNTKGKNGAEFTFAKPSDSPQLFTNFYIFFGRVDVEMQVAPGIGIISSSVLMSDSFDEIDWEMSGNNFNLTSQYPNGVVQNNYFSKGITGSYDRGMFVPLDNPQTTFYTYSVDWTPAKLDWLINGKVVRTFRAKDADHETHQYPQTPSKIQLGLWDGGDPGQNDGTKRWAGGITDFSKAPFTMFVKSVRITNYNPARYYNWTNQSGNTQGIKALNITLPDPTTAAPTTTSLEPLRTDLAVSPNGHCGKGSGTICKDSMFGDCCSFYNYCGNTTEYCGFGCQSAFGVCGPMNPIATTGVPLVSTSLTSSSAPAAQPSTSQTSISTDPTTTVIISLSRTTTPPSSEAPPPPPTQLPTTSSTTEPVGSTKPDVPATSTTSTKASSLETAVETTPPSKYPTPPVVEKPVVSTGQESSSNAAIPPAPTETKKPESSTAIVSPTSTSTSNPKPTTPTTAAATSSSSSSSKSSSSSSSSSSTAKAATSTPSTSKPPDPTTTAAATTAKPAAPTTSQAPTATSTTTTAAQGQITISPITGKTTTASTNTQGATTIPAQPTTSAASPKPVPRQLCFWWGRWYCFYYIYKRAYPVEARAYRAAQG